MSIPDPGHPPDRNTRYLCLHRFNYPAGMPMDDNPIEALRKQFELEDSSKSPVSRGLAKAAIELIKLARMPAALEAIIEKMSVIIVDDGNERTKIMLQTVADEVIKHDRDIRQIRETQTAEQNKARREQEAGLIVDGARRASVTRSIERVRRIGIILAHSIAEPKMPNGDEIEEMMRIATELTDVDVQYLRDLVTIEGKFLKGRAHIERYTAYLEWERGPWRSNVNPEIDSVFHKLESYGLVSALAPNNTFNVTADIQTRYVLLPKGLRFAELIAI